MTVMTIDVLIRYLTASQAAYGNVLVGTLVGIINDSNSGFTELQKIDFNRNFDSVIDSGVNTDSGFQAV